ncbi:hypothetical protein RSOLAG22IIIB_11622 [Rhizoctonia solani]|uniref:Uncharacterized protein n=1 Tax=Rhizoctonia solani TaxID=456999 RepID=A0A0K6GA03_9AGAM|nr:hypothetical protein RSOLAG22IIIB_11622 [Rhizoctonia solani]
MEVSLSDDGTSVHSKPHFIKKAMGKRLAYPDAPLEKLDEIYRQSLRKPIHAYGFFVDPVALYKKIRGRPESPDTPIEKDVGLFLWDIQLQLYGIGLHKLAIVDIPSAKQYRKIYPQNSGWLIVLGTGFDKTLHVPVSDEFTQCVRNILQTEEPPAWWSMKKFTYPNPKLWIEGREKMMRKAQE